MRNLTVASVLMLVAASCLAGSTVMIDDCEYADEGAAQRAWQIAEQSDPVQLMAHEDETGKTAVKMPCRFTRDDYDLSINTPRAVYDRRVSLDLSTYGSIIFDFYADDPSPIRNCTLYFHSAAGWYGTGFAPARGWKRFELAKGAFGIEDSPGGWQSIDTIRICAWRGSEKDTFCAFDNLQARREDIAVVRGTPGGSEDRTARDCADRVGSWLGDLGIPFGTFTDGDVEQGALEGQKLAIFAYSPTMSDEEAQMIAQFIAGGGKVFFFYSIREDVARLLGVESYQYAAREYDGQYNYVVFDADALKGLPQRMFQGTWNINAPTIGGHNGRAIGYWQDKEGKRGAPAVVVSDNGAYMGHILNGGDDDAKRLFLISLIGHFLPEAWEQAAGHALDGAVRVGPFASRADLEAYLIKYGPKTRFVGAIEDKLNEATRAEHVARQSLTAGRYTDAITQAKAINDALGEAYQYAHKPRDGEFRAVWNHSGTGDVGTWEDAMKALSRANFNAVVPNMWWAGVAHYDSEYLPHSSTFKQKGDQIAQAVAAGKRYGIEVHPWKVNWNLSTAPDEFVDQLREEGRLQARSNGEEMRWLCPSHPKNFQLELNTMLEVVRKYDVAGVHFDYIRYPHGDSCYCEGCRQRFSEHIGHQVENWPADCVSGKLSAQWRQWRCDQITRLVKATAEAARKIKPHIKISAAVFSGYPGTKQSIGQDWLLWCKEGWLDFVCPMDYQQSDATFTNLVRRQVGQVAGTVPLYTGIGHWRISDDQAIGQMEISRALGADGFILFNMGASLADTGFPKFAKAITSQKATLPHNGPVVRFRTTADNDEPIVETNRRGLRFSAAVTSLGRHRREAVAVRGQIVLQDTDGNQLAQLANLPALNAVRWFNVKRQPGVLRVAAVGELVFADGTTRKFIRRSRPYRFIEQ